MKQSHRLNSVAIAAHAAGPVGFDCADSVPETAVVIIW